MKKLLTIVVTSCGLLQAGCLFKTTSPISGEKVTAAQLASEHQYEKMKEAQEQIAISQKLADAQRTFDRQQQESARSFDKACRELQAQADDRIRQLAAQYEQDRLTAEQALYEVQTSGQRSIDALKAKAETRNQAIQVALDDIKQQQEQAGVLLSMTESIAGGFGATGGAIGAGIGLIGTLIGLRGKRQAAEVQTAASRVIDAIDVLKQTDQGVASAFKNNAALLNEWMGESGKALVDRVQETKS